MVWFPSLVVLSIQTESQFNSVSIWSVDPHTVMAYLQARLLKTMLLYNYIHKYCYCNISFKHNDHVFTVGVNDKSQIQ